MSSVDRLEGLTGRQAVKVACRMASVGNLVLSGSQVVDSIMAADGDRVLAHQQNDPAENGIYVANTAGNWTRAPDFDGDYDIRQGTLVYIAEGYIYGRRIFAVTTVSPAIGGNLVFDTVSAGGGMLSFEYYPYVISGFLPVTPVGGYTGLELDIPAGTAMVGGLGVTFPGAIVTLPVNAYSEVYIADTGELIIESAESYWTLPNHDDWVKLLRVNTDASKIIGVIDFRNMVLAERVMKQEGALHLDKLIGDYDIPQGAAVYAPSTYYSYGQKVTNGAKMYQNFGSGMSGAASAPTGYVGETWSEELETFVFVDGDCRWFFVAESVVFGGFRWGANNGVVWYFSNIAVLHLLDRLPSARIQTYLDTYIFNLVTRWAGGVSIQEGMRRYYNQQVYQATTTGATGGTPPAGTGSAIDDGGVIWKWVCKHVGEYPAWAASTAVAVGDRRVNATNIYECVAGGVTGLTGPVGWLSSQTDGAVVWKFLNPVGGFSQGADWYVLDTQTDRVTIRHADSHDAYASSFLRLASEWIKSRNDTAWLGTLNVHSKTNLATLLDIGYANLLRCAKTYAPWVASTVYEEGRIVQANGNVYLCTTGGTSAGAGGPSGTESVVIDGTCIWAYQYLTIAGLITTFQNELHSDGSMKWDWCYLQDNCENYSGLKAFADLLTSISDVNAGTYQAAAVGLAAAINGLYQASSKSWRFADKVLTVGTAFYPDVMANIFPELHQVPLPPSAESTADKYNHGYEFACRTFPTWWYRRPDGLASLVLAYVAGRYRQEPKKAMLAVEHATAHHLRQGLPQLGTFMLSDLAYAFAIRAVITDPLGTTGVLPVWRGRLKGSLLPSEDNQYDCGSAAIRFRDGTFAGSLAAGSLAISGAAAVAGTATVSGLLMALDGILSSAHVDLSEVTTPGTPQTNRGRLFARDNGAGKTQLCVNWPGGATSVLATEP